jgi:hypothetical protein
MIRLTHLQLFFALLVGAGCSDLFGMTTNEKYDPFPLYTTLNPHEFLTSRELQEMRGRTPDTKSEHVNVTITIFGQQAKDGNNKDKVRVPLGDMMGDWNMLALTYDACPGSAIGDVLELAGTQTFCDTEKDVPVLFNDPEALTTGTQVSANIGPYFGHVSVPLKYRKVGGRFELSAMLFGDLGMRLQGGVADIEQALSITSSQGKVCGGFVDLSPLNLPSTSGGCPGDPCCQESNLAKAQLFLTGTQAIETIAKEISLSVDDFHKTSIEDFRASLFWRHLFLFNEKTDIWPKFCIMPFAQLIGTFALGAQKNKPCTSFDKQFAVSFGNNGHNSIGFNAGFTLDFEETVEIAFEGGGTFFEKKEEMLRFPVNFASSGIFPCRAVACVKPGDNWHCIGTLHARRFVDKLSGHIQVALVSHGQDCITVSQDPDASPPLLVPAIKQFSKWDLSLLNMALDYEISPNISLGFLWSAPLGRRNCPRTNTILGSLIGYF